MPFRYPTPLAGCRVVLALLLLATGCSQSPPGKSATGETTRGPTDSARAHLTDHYVKLLRAQLTAKDPYQAAVAVHCEQLRVMRVMTQSAADPLQAENAAGHALRSAESRAFTPSDEPARDRVDIALDGKVFTAEVGCDSLAKAGVLGDTVWPVFQKWKK
jgi:hypothetical protein